MTIEYGNVRRIDGDIIYSPASPRVRVRYSPVMIYLGDLQYLLNQDRYVQAFVFINVNSLGHVTQTLLVQFEGYLEGKGGAYENAAGQTVALYGQDYFYEVGFLDLPDYLKEHRGTDIARAADYIRQRAYTLPGDVVIQRFTHLVDAEHRNRMVILYMEANDDNALNPTRLVEDEAVAKALLERAKASFSIL